MSGGGSRMVDTPAAPSAAPILARGTLRLRQCRHGMMLYDLKNVLLGGMLARYGEYAESQIDIFRQQLRPGMTVDQVGANIGAQALAFAHAVGAAGRVVALRPGRAMV